MRVALVVLAVGASACGHKAPEATSGEPVAGCTLTPLGDPHQPIAMKLMAAAVNDMAPFMYAGTPQPLANGGTVPIIAPPQGGFVVYIGARATNIDPCGVQVSGVITDTASNLVRVDERTANLTPYGDGWGGPMDHDPLAPALANVAVCPNEWASSDAYGVPFKLTISLTERSGRKASRSIQATLSCAEPQNKASCSCQCKKGYMLGETCH